MEKVTKRSVARLVSLAAEKPTIFVNQRITAIGDNVRLANKIFPFKKNYKQNFTEESFTVMEVATFNPPTYNLRDEREENVKGNFREPKRIAVDGWFLESTEPEAVYPEHKKIVLPKQPAHRIQLDFDWPVALVGIVFSTSVVNIVTNECFIRFCSKSAQPQFRWNSSTALMINCRNIFGRTQKTKRLLEQYEGKNSHQTLVFNQRQKASNI